MKCEICNKEKECLPVGPEAKEVCFRCALEKFPDETGKILIADMTPASIIERLTLTLSGIIRSAHNIGIYIKSIHLLEIDKNTGDLKFEIDSSKFETNFKEVFANQPKLDPTGKGYDA